MSDCSPDDYSAAVNGADDGPRKPCGCAIDETKTHDSGFAAGKWVRSQQVATRLKEYIAAHGNCCLSPHAEIGLVKIIASIEAGE